jgi:thiamine biosynthesis lipoprotein
MNNKKRLMWQLPFLTLLVVGSVLIVRQQRSMPYQNNKGMVFGTTYNITYQSDKNLNDEICRELQKVDNSLSPFNAQSIITAVNQNEAKPLNDMFKEVFNRAMAISDDTDGAFDITVAPLVNAWGFGFKNGVMPDSRQVDSLLQLVGYEKVALKSGRVVKQDPRIMLDCSAIAKGYGSDVVARFLRGRDIKNFMVEIGGEIVTSGVNPKRVPWKIGVTKPTDDTLSVSSELQTVLNVTDKAMATSGNYRNYYYKGGKKYAHTINPKTGYPVQHSLLSATVLARDCATADAYATSFMVMGLDAAKRVLERHPEMMAYLIYSDDQGRNAVWYSPSLKDKIVE